MRRALGGVLIAVACTPSPQPHEKPTVVVTVTARDVGTRVVTAEQMLAACEMQISGEPLAEAMGRDLGGYSRDALPPGIYFDTKQDSPGPWIDLAGFSTGVESYEYSKQPMNNLAFESGAGTSLAYGPGFSPDAGVQELAARVKHFGESSHALGRYVFEPGTWPSSNPSGNVNPFGAGRPQQNPLGWPGLWPTLHPFRSFDPRVDPTGEVRLWCSVSSDDDPGATGAAGCADYECDATSLHLRDRLAQVERVITPGADGFSGWKYALWTLNYLQVMHDVNETALVEVAAMDQGSVGASGNTVVGTDEDGAEGEAGTFVGSSDLEGFQASVLIEELDQRARDWLFNLSTADGATLGGFADLDAALKYGVASPLRWFPAAIAVSETDEGQGFPRPAYALASADSRLLDQAGLLLAYATVFTLTDTTNANVGGAATARVYFDGDPFPGDDQLPDGEPTLHDRALAMMRVGVVNLDRLHATPVLVDDVTFTGATPRRGVTVSTTSLAYAVIALRTVQRALSSQLELYSNNVPDRALGASRLDALPLAVGRPETLSERIRALLAAQGSVLLDGLTRADGRAFSGWDVERGAPVSEDDVLDAHTAAVRALFAMFLATGDVKYRERALAVFARLQAVFYDPEARVYFAAPVPQGSVTYTPVRFALLQSTLRDVYQLWASRPGHEAMALELESHLGRLNKLVLNGWDDRDHDRQVDWPGECVNTVDALPLGGLQMAERTLTGESGSLSEMPIPLMRVKTADRELDCVPEVDDAHLPAMLAGSITFDVVRTP